MVAKMRKLKLQPGDLVRANYYSSSGTKINNSNTLKYNLLILRRPNKKELNGIYFGLYLHAEKTWWYVLRLNSIHNKFCFFEENRLEKYNGKNKF